MFSFSVAIVSKLENFAYLDATASYQFATKRILRLSQSATQCDSRDGPARHEPLLLMRASVASSAPCALPSKVRASGATALPSLVRSYSFPFQFSLWPLYRNWRILHTWKRQLLISLRLVLWPFVVSFSVAILSKLAEKAFLEATGSYPETTGKRKKCQGVALCVRAAHVNF